MKFVPNIISTIRIFCSIILAFLKPLSAVFFIIYIICGASDILDGFIARKMNSTSQAGAMLDSIADTIFLFVFMVIFIPILKLDGWMVYWVTTILFVRITSLIIGFWKYHTYVSLHTYSNKITGIVIFCFPFFYTIFGLSMAVGFICMMAILSAIEELLINLTSKELSRDRKSIFSLF